MNSPNEAGPVVAGVDGSQPALDAVRWACAEVVARGRTTLRLVSALGTRAEYGYGPRRSWGNIYDEIVGETSHHLGVAAAVAREASGVSRLIPGCGPVTPPRCWPNRPWMPRFLWSGIAD